MKVKDFKAKWRRVRAAFILKALETEQDRGRTIDGKTQFAAAVQMLRAKNKAKLGKSQTEDNPLFANNFVTNKPDESPTFNTFNFTSASAMLDQYSWDLGEIQNETKVETKTKTDIDANLEQRNDNETTNESDYCQRSTIDTAASTLILEPQKPVMISNECVDGHGQKFECYVDDCGIYVGDVYYEYEKMLGLAYKWSQSDSDFIDFGLYVMSHIPLFFILHNVDKRAVNALECSMNACCPQKCMEIRPRIIF